MLNPRHIQDYHDGNVTTQAYWAYPARVVSITTQVIHTLVLIQLIGPMYERHRNMRVP